ncbi:hypothetical protein EV702DRAFT_624937 [Suillus placidus]|uniref:Uncharacterized protein n=1 Tax=Suillus placidus TaxID=48579 RepID=A0A9P7CZU4_9AGAM|nr:hypothetical protein EV702DRAFT_624937 [Suillus placidus]
MQWVVAVLLVPITGGKGRQAAVTSWPITPTSEELEGACTYRDKRLEHAGILVNLGSRNSPRSDPVIFEVPSFDIMDALNKSAVGVI